MVGSDPGPDAPRSDVIFARARRWIMFVLGIAVIVEGLASPGAHVTQQLVGLVLLGIIPVDEMLSRLPRRPPP